MGFLNIIIILLNVLILYYNWKVLSYNYDALVINFTNKYLSEGFDEETAKKKAESKVLEEVPAMKFVKKVKEFFGKFSKHCDE